MTTANKNVSKLPNWVIEVETNMVKPAAGPETLRCELLISPTTIPPAIPANRPENDGAPEPKAIPRHKGNATKNTSSDGNKFE